MIKRGRTTGFTIVELIVVIVVIALLTAMAAMLYGRSQTQARDVQVRNAAQKFADAIQLMSAQRGGVQPSGGTGSTTTATATGCANGSGGFQDYNRAGVDSNYKCTLGDAVVAMDYLKADVFTALPPNTAYNSNKYMFMVYPCANNSKQWNFMYTLEAPTATDTATLNNTLTACGTTPGTYAPITTNNMKAVIVIKFS